MKNYWEEDIYNFGNDEEFKEENSVEYIEFGPPKRNGFIDEPRELTNPIDSDELVIL